MISAELNYSLHIPYRFERGLQSWVDVPTAPRHDGRMWLRIIKGLAERSAVEVLRIWAIPVIGTGASVMIGWAQNIPWFYICVGASVVFAAISTGILRFSEWKYRSKAQDKLVFSSVKVGHNWLEDGSMASMRLGFTVSNKALFPIEFKVERLMTSVGEHHSPKKKYDKDYFLIPIDGDGWFNDHDININRKITGSDEGVIEFELLYGRPGNLKYKLKQRKRVYFGVSSDGKISGANWIDE